MNGAYGFLIRLLLVFIAIVAIVYLAREAMLPNSWGKYGYYRGNYIDEEASRAMVYGENDSCKSCHAEVNDLKAHSSHKRLSCEICHAPITTHVKDAKKIATMPTKQGKEQVDLCLKCHQKVVGRADKFPMIKYPEHLEEQKVKTTHTCDQCHMVHAPLENIEHVKKLRAVTEALHEK